MKWFFRKFNNWKLGYKILFTFLVGGIIPLLVSQQISYYLNSHFMTDNMDDMIVNNLKQMSERTDLTLDSYNNLLYQIYTDDDIIQNINELQDDSVMGKAAAYNRIYSRLKQFNVFNTGIRCISIICNDGQSVIYDFETGSTLDNIWSGTEDMCKTEPYLDAIDQIGLIVTPTMEMEVNGEKEYFFHLSKRMFDLDKLEKGTIATAVVSVDADVLGDILTTDTRNEVAFIIDENKQIIYYPDKIFMGVTLDDDVDPLRVVELSHLLNNKNKLINEYENDRLNWKFYYVYDKDFVLKDMKNLQNLVLCLFLAVAIIAIIMIVYTVRHVHQSIKGVVIGMNQIQNGNLDIVIPVTSQDEIGQMAENFNEMASELKRLIQEVKEALDKQKNAEIKSLEAQINPHFLYNTLDSINWMAIEKGEYEISDMLRNLGVILRYSINKSNQMVTIAEIQDWLQKYIVLQKVRFNDAFDFKLNVQEELREVKLHKLLMQPFVENAIIHGFDGIEQGGLLTIDLLLAEGKEAVCVIIEDNGKGMPSELTKQYNDRNWVINNQEKRIGLTNALERIAMYYGEDGTWNIKSVENMGTVITLILPTV